MALLRTEPSWTIFLQAAGIPTTEAATYAKILMDNRINEKSVCDLTTDLLQQLKITVLGDQLSIIRHAKTLQSAPIATADSTGHTSASQPTDTATAPVTNTRRTPSITMKIPNISNEMTHPQFRKFRIDWSVFKKINNIPTDQIGEYLYSACDDGVQTSIINSHDTFFSDEEEEMLQCIERIVTKRVNPTVHRMHFGNLKQSDGETMQDFLTRIKSAAIDCEFNCPDCESDISRVDIKIQFIRGISNETLQTDILAKASQLKSVEDVFKYAEAWEGALRDQSSIQQSNTTDMAARVTDYKKMKGSNGKKHSKFAQEKLSCSGCGSTEHGISGTNPRHSHCPGWGRICSSCKNPNHLAKACPNDSNTSYSNALIAHVSTNQSEIIEISATLTPEFNGSCSTEIDIFPDSGANICLAGFKQLNEMGLHRFDLIPTQKRVKTVGGKMLQCIG